MTASKDGKTAGITLRLKRTVLDAYAEIANRENAADLQKGGRGLKSIQDVMRETLEAHPEVAATLGKPTTPNN